MSVHTIIGRAEPQSDLDQADVGVKSDVEGMVDFAVKEFGRLNVMVSNAGVVHKASLMEHTEADIDRVFQTNVKR